MSGLERVPQGSMPHWHRTAPDHDGYCSYSTVNEYTVGWSAWCHGGLCLQKRRPSPVPHVKEYTDHCCPGTGPHRLAPQLETLQSSSPESCFLLSYRGCRGFPASGPEGREDMPEGSLLGGPGDPGDVDILLLRGFLKSL